MDITSGSASLTASQLQDQETMSRKSAAAASTALSIAEYIDNYPGMPEGARAAMLLLKLDIISFLNYAWREVHNKMLLRRSIALDCLERTLPPIDQDQKLALLHAPFKGTTLFGGELAKLQEANTKRSATFTVFPQPTAPPTSYSTRPYAGRGKSFRDKKGFKKPGGRGQGRSAPTTTITRPGQSKDSQKALTVSVSTDSKKRKSESQEEAPQGPRKVERNFRGDKNKGNKQCGCAPPTSVSSRREIEQLCGGVQMYYERSLRSEYCSQGVQTSFYESTPSPTNSLGDKISTGSKRSFGHAGTNHPYAPKERDNGSASRLTRVLLERIPGKKGFRRVASSHRSKESECTHSRTSFPYVHDKLCSKLHRKRRLRVQDRSAGCVLSCTDSSKQQEIPQVGPSKTGCTSFKYYLSV